MITPVQKLVGKTVGRYHILDKLGAGGMGVVFRAFDERLQRVVALKLLSSNLDSQSEIWTRILSEARVASSLNHPGITTIYEVGEEEQQLFISMELVQGKSLRELLSSGGVKSRALIRIGAQIADALAAAHVRRVVHGDIKPENIMVLPDERVKLLDFGLARHIRDESLTVTEVGNSEFTGGPSIAGTIAYMAPEQFASGLCDERTDLFSLGVVLYEMAAGTRPFCGPSAAALASQVAHDNPPSLGETMTGIPPQLGHIIFKLLEKKPTERYQSAEDLRADLVNLSRVLELGVKLPSAVANKTAVAVLPFKLLTPNPEDDYLRVALAEPLINRLSASSDLLVRPINAVMAYATRTTDFLLAAHELNVQLLVDGNVQRFGHRLRVHVQAWNISDGSSRLSEKFDAEITELFELQDRIADSLAKELVPNVSQTPRECRPTSNAQAYELFLRAMERMTRNNRWDTRIAIEMLENATVLDEKFADAWAGLAEACVQMGGIFEPGSKWITRAEKAMRCSLSLDHENVEAHIANGRIVWTPARNFQHRAALYALKEALRRRPTHDQALSWQGCILMHIGLQPEAKESLTSALAVCPDNAFTLTFLGTNSVYAGEYSEARECYARALSLDRASLWANLLSPAAPLYAGQLEQASQAIRAARQILPKDSLLTSYEALLWAKRGERRKADQCLQKALYGNKTLLHTHHMMHTVAATYAMLEKPQQAITWLRKASATGLPIYPAYRDDPHFACMRSHPQFLRLLTHLKRKWTSFKVEFGHQGNRN